MDSDLKTSGKQMLKRLSALGRKADGLIHEFVSTRLDETPGDDDLRVFVSYRRDAGPGEAHHLASDLEKHLGPDRVFLDQRTIAAGEEWSRVIAERVAACDVLLAVIGPGWLEARDDSGRQRLTREDDYVRHEIEAALGRRVPVIPVSTPGATLPPRDALPDTLKPMLDHPALAVEILREDFWAVAVDSLARWLTAIKEEKQRTQKGVGRAAEHRAGLERDIQRASDKHSELATGLQAAREGLARLDTELPAAQEQLAQRRQEAEPTRAGPGLRTYISFRTETSAQASRLERDLQLRLGEDRVIGTQPLGADADVAAVTAQRVGGCDVLLTMIGPGWLTSRDDRGRGLADADDTARLEMESALRRPIPLIPLLIHVHDVPEADVLPASVRSLLSHQAMPLPDQFWDSAVDKLMAEFDRIEQDIERREAAVAQAAERQSSLEREAVKARKLQTEREAALNSAEAKLAALQAKLEQAVAQEQQLTGRHADEGTAFLAGPPRPRTAAAR